MKFTAVLVGSFFALLIMGVNANSQNSQEDILKTLNFQRGRITLGDNLATIDLTKRFVFINSKDTETFLTKIWSNPPGAGSDALGMILPTDVNPLSAEGWAVIISYMASGYVSDKDAAEINYDQLLRDMQEATRKENTELAAKGYTTHELIGWARQPYYDSKAKKLYWAKRLHFSGQANDTLNYEIRILGRGGVLSLNIVDDIDALPKLDGEVSNLLNMVSFNAGNLYSEFNPSVDTAAAYGLAGLIAGGILTKAGFFKGLLLMILAFKKLFAVAVFGGLAALWAGLKAFFSRKSKA